MSEADRPLICAILQSAAQLAPAELEGLFQVEVILQIDGDASTDLVAWQQLTCVQEARFEICDEGRCSGPGYD